MTRVQTKKVDTPKSIAHGKKAFVAERHRMIKEAAYYIAEKRGFDGNHELDDWIEAERMINETAD